MGVEGARESPFFRRELSAAATYLSLVNFEIESQSNNTAAAAVHSVNAREPVREESRTSPALTSLDCFVCLARCSPSDLFQSFVPAAPECPHSSVLTGALGEGVGLAGPCALLNRRTAGS